MNINLRNSGLRPHAAIQAPFLFTLFSWLRSVPPGLFLIVMCALLAGPPIQATAQTVGADAPGDIAPRTEAERGGFPHAALAPLSLALQLATVLQVASPEKFLPVTLAGKIVAVRKGALTMTVDPKGRQGLFELAPQVKILKDGEEIALEELVAGQEVSLTLREVSYGHFEVVSVRVGPPGAQARRPESPLTENVAQTPPPAPGPPPAAPEVSPSEPTPDAFTTAPDIVPPKQRKHEISVSGDFLIGQGTVTLPIGFSLAQSLTKSFGSGALGGFRPLVADPERESQYFGGTVSYSYGRKWFIDLSFAHGTSSGNTPIDIGGGDNLDADFSIDDDWYQAYIRYVFPGLRGKSLSAYLRAGMSYVQAELTAGSTVPPFGLYKQTDETTDLLGNLGFGVTYYPDWLSGKQYRFGLQVEGEGFYGQRSQDSLEILPKTLGVTFETVTIDNDLYGGIGRATMRFEYRFGKTEAFRVFADGGVQAKYTLIEYPDTSAPKELLWGPYVKVGVRYNF